MLNHYLPFMPSRSGFRKAGKALIRCDPLLPEAVESIRAINTLRIECLRPLEKFYRFLSRCAEKFETPPLIGMRIKGLKPIVDKLNRYPTMNFMQMQDIIGARVVVENMNKLAEFKRLCTRPGSGFKLLRERNYIDEPRACGYRAALMIFLSTVDACNTEWPVLIELEIMTKSQHLWASAMETIRMFRPESRMTKRFMPTIASLFALSEGTPPLHCDHQTPKKDLLVRFGKRQLLMWISFCAMHLWDTDSKSPIHESAILLVAEQYPDGDSSDCSCHWDSIRRYGFFGNQLRMAQEIAFGYEDSPRYWNGLTKAQLVYTETPERIKDIFPAWFGIAKEFEDELWKLFKTIDTNDLVRTRRESG